MPCCSRYASDPATAWSWTAATVRRHVRAAQGEQHAGRLRRAERQVERGHGDPARAERPPGRADAGPRAGAGSRRASTGRQPEPGGGAPGPAARPGHGQLAGEVGQVVVGAVPPDPVDPEHRALPHPHRRGERSAGIRLAAQLHDRDHPRRRLLVVGEAGLRRHLGGVEAVPLGPRDDRRRRWR